MAILTVGGGQQFQTIAAAVAASHDGDVIQVQAGTYVNDFAEITTKITIEGVGGLAHIVATASPPNGKAILTTDTDVHLDHLELSGASVADGNGAGIRYQGGALTVTNSFIHDNQDGILGNADPNGSVTVDGSEIANNGAGDGRTHNLYIGAVASFTLTNSYVHDPHTGHDVKSRAAVNTITGNRIQDNAAGDASYLIDLPNGGAATIADNILQKGTAAQNPVLISSGEEGSSNPNPSLTVSDNVIVNDLTAHAAVIVANHTAGPALLRDNTLWGVQASAELGPVTTAGNTVLALRPALDTSWAPSGPDAPAPIATPIAVPTPAVPSVTIAPDPAPVGPLPNTPALDASVLQGAGAPGVYRFFDTATGTQFLTGSASETATLLRSRPDLTFEGLGLNAAPPPSRDPNAAPVYRFFDVSDGTHFFTTDSGERDQLLATRPDLALEQTSFYEHVTAMPGDTAVYRFFDTIHGTHFYTDSAAERANVDLTRADLKDEGVAFYSPAS